MNIDWNNSEAKISKFFSVREVTQNDKRRIPIKGSSVEGNILLLADKMDTVRGLWGRPIKVSSWYRPYTVNLEVGGVSNSQHLSGRAIDVYSDYGDSLSFEKFLDDVWGDLALGYGVRSGKGFTHLDLRAGHIRFWY